MSPGPLRAHPSSPLFGVGLAVLAGCASEPTAPVLDLLNKHANLGDPAADTSNKVARDPAAAALGKTFYFDPDFSGAATLVDTLRRPMSTAGRAAKGEAIRISCATCH